MNTPRRSGLPVAGSTAEQRGELSKAMPGLTARKSLGGLRQASLDAAETPKRSSLQHHPLPGAASSSGNTNNATESKRKLEIGDEVVAEVNLTRFTGVLRHLGPVHFRPGIFAGLELTGESTGKGKNDGSVDGQQYFACEPGNGMFCPAAKVKQTSSAPATEATARPQSAMSSRSGRSSVAEYHDRPSSVSSNRPRSSMASSAARPPSTTPGRTASRTSIGRPGSSMATPSAKLPRLLPRKSVADGLADEEGRRRAKTSAEEAEKAEGRITEGSRAHRYLNMSAKDLEDRRVKTPGIGGISFSTKTGAAGGRVSSPNKAGTNSPLKDSLLGANRKIATPRNRSSIGSTQPTTSTLTTPKAAKARSSMFASSKGLTSNMLPPPGNGSPSRLVPPSRTKPAPRTPSRLSSTHDSESDRGAEDGEEGAKARNRSLLEQMELLTPRHVTTELRSNVGDDSMPAFDVENGFGGGAGLALLPDGDGEAGEDHAVAQAVVPLSLYEESNLEITQLKAQLNDTKKALAEARSHVDSAQNTELERAKVKAQEEVRKELEEERNVEREDEQRRRKAELDEKEKQWKEKMDGVQREFRKLQDEHSRAKSEHEKAIGEMGDRLKEKETLMDKLRNSVASNNEAGAQIQGQLQAKDFEISQLNERIQRLEASREQEKAELVKEIDELKDAGQETLDMFDREQTVSNERIAELEKNMHLLEARAQEAIADAIRERDEALQGVKRSSIAEIGQKSLEEQLAQAQNRAASLEDQLNEANTIMQQEREAYVKRKDRYAEGEAKLKAEITKWKKQVQHLEYADADSRQRVEELHEALTESRSALENERAELETLRAEAMIMGEGPDGQTVQALERGRFEVEIERLTGLLEGARSGKREVSRQVDELRKQIAEMHTLLDDARVQLEADKQQANSERTSRLDESSHVMMSELRQSLQERERELEALRTAGKSIPEQVELVLQNANKEIASKDEELQALRRRMDELARRSGVSTSLTIPSSSGASIDSQGSPNAGASNIEAGSSPVVVSHGVFSPGLSASKRFSTASTQSRRSYGSVGGNASVQMSSSEAMAKEMAGLRSIVNTLNQELTEVKVSSKQQERELQGRLERYKNEVARLELLASGAGQPGDAQAIDARMALDVKLQESGTQIETLKKQIAALERSKRQEVQKLNQDIAELEALCEATVWRREEQEARRQELERKVAKLQRQLERTSKSENGKQASEIAGHASQDSHSTEPSHARSVSNGDAKSLASVSTVSTNASSVAAAAAAAAPPIATAAQTPSAAANQTGPSDACVECNETGHTIDDCPYLNDDVLF